MEEGGKDTSSKQNLKLLGKIAAGIGIVAGFWMAIGPILSPFVKLIGALFLILLMPFIKAIMPAIVDNLPMIVEKVKGVAEGITDILNWFQKNFGTTGSLIAAIAGLLVLNAVVSMATGAITGALGLFMTVGGKLLPVILQAGIRLVTAIIGAAGNFISWLVPALGGTSGLPSIAAGLGIVAGIIGLAALIYITESKLTENAMKQMEKMKLGFIIPIQYQDQTVTAVGPTYQGEEITTGQITKALDSLGNAIYTIEGTLSAQQRFDLLQEQGAIKSYTPEEIRDIAKETGHEDLLSDPFKIVGTIAEKFGKLNPKLGDTTSNLGFVISALDSLKTESNDTKDSMELLRHGSGIDALKLSVDNADGSVNSFSTTLVNAISAINNALKQAQMAAQQASISAASSASTLQNIKKQSTYSGGYFNR